MEMQFFILGHILLYAICCAIAASPFYVEFSTPHYFTDILVFAGAFFFIPLEIVYWVLHFIFV